MPTRLTLLGLGRIGASLALTLRPRADLLLTGFDRSPGAARSAVSRVESNLGRSVEGADLVLVALPLDEQREALAEIAPRLREGCVVVSLAPLLRPPLAWAADLLPPERYFVAAHPILNPVVLTEPPAAEPRADLFARGLWAVAPARGCVAEAVQLVSDLATLLQAAPYFIDPVEHDGVMGGADALPALLALALMQTAAASPGWGELSKMAGERFAAATALLNEAERAPLVLNRDSLLHYLDAVLVELQSLRARVAARDAAAFDEALAEAAKLRARWLAERARADWTATGRPAPEMPTGGSMLGRLVGLDLFKKRGEKSE